MKKKKNKKEPFTCEVCDKKMSSKDYLIDPVCHDCCAKSHKRFLNGERK